MGGGGFGRKKRVEAKESPDSRIVDLRLLFRVEFE